MKELVQRALDTAASQGASYADARVVRQETQRVMVKNGTVESVSLDEEAGFGIRALVDGAWGFASSYRLTAEEIDKVAAEAVRIARAFREHGCDIVDVSAGQTTPDAQPVYGRLFQTPYADRVRHEAEIPTMTVGNISSYSDVNSILVAGRADLCVLARAHLYDPYWTRHAATEQDYDLPWPDQYCSVARYKPRFR